MDKAPSAAAPAAESRVEFYADDESYEPDFEDDEEDGDNADGPPSFQVGLESSQDRLHELQFSLVHHASTTTPLPGGGAQMASAEFVEDEDLQNQQELIANEIEEFAARYEQYEPSSGGFMGPPGLFDDEDNEEDLGLLAIQRVDSKDVVFDNRQKKAKILSHYVMGDVLGEGSYAKVKEAVDQVTLCRRAVKIMKRKKLRRIPNGEKNAECEIKLLATLRHKNVMELVEVFYNDEKGKIYIVLEYCCAVLKDMLEQSDMKKFPTWQAHFYFKQLMDGLGYLHSRGIIHKDIKPGNLLLNTAGILKIADFGTVEILDRFAPDDSICSSQGTPAFQPPEIANGVESFPGFKVDVWSSGITLYNFVTGEYPFNGDTIFRLFEAIGRCEVRIPKDLDPILANLISGMLREDPQIRFSLQDIREHDWFRKKHPCISPPVTVKPRDDDPALSTTVIPYLCDLHYGSQLIHETEGAEEFITEHEVKEIERQKKSSNPAGAAATESGGAAANNGDSVPSRSTEEKEKTTKCIKVRKLGDCAIA